MPQRERWQPVQDILKDLRGLDPLKRLFWSELNYDHVNQPLSRRGWSDTADEALAQDPVLFAGHQDFHIIYARLNSDRLLLGQERTVVSRLSQDHPYSLFVFSTVAQDRWHFVNVKLADDPQKRRLFRRFTIGPTERLRTASERIALLDVGDRKHSPLEVQLLHDEAFNVEDVTKQFFATFAELYHKVADDIREVRGLEQEAGRLAQLLLDRLIFLYFIQKKAWLDGKPDYLYARFLDIWKKAPKGSNYYSDVLYPLFLCLSDADVKIDSVGAVPFLNGGLFEESMRQAQAKRLALARLSIKNVTFRVIFDDLLERFNFTITEVTPLDVEVAIDPEMLGKIFESLILELEKDPKKDLRKLTGSYYTPRPIVHFMCREALKEYLVMQLADEDAPKTEHVRAKVETLLDLPQADQLDEDQTSTLKQLLTISEAKALREAILHCRVCDPAVGSGAFPVGMLHEMVAAIGRLDVRLDGPQAIQRRNYDYGLKKAIIESCLYGVDIQEQAVRLCELRLWLSLVVDYQIAPDRAFAEAMREVPNLPNLSYRIMRGDSLLERLFGHVVQLDEMARDEKSLDLIEAVQRDKQAYFNEGSTVEKRRLELKILVKQAGLAERLIEAKSATLKGYQTGMFGETTLSTKERKARDEHEELVEQLDDLKRKVAAAKDQLELLARQKAVPSTESLDGLRRKYFKGGDAPTFIWGVDFAEVFRDSMGFDIVIGNPPYLFGEHLASSGREYPRNYELATGQYDAYWLFIERDCRLLLRERGVHCFIHSDAFLARDETTKLRQWLLRRCTAVTIAHVGTVFPGVGVSAVVVKFRSSSEPATSYELVEYDDVQMTFGKRIVGPLSSPQEDPKRRIPTKVGSKTWLDRLLASPHRFADFFTISRGEEIGKSNLARTGGAKPPYGSVLILAGEGISSLRPPIPRHSVAKAVISKPRDNYRPPKVVLVKTGRSFVASVDEVGVYTLQSVYNIHSTSDLSEYVACALLNSFPLNYLLADRVTNQKKLFPQITQGNVLEMPIPPLIARDRATLERLVKGALKGDIDPRDALAAIDEIVFTAFGFDKSQVSALRGGEPGNAHPRHHRQP